MQFHPLAEIFPLVEGSDLEALTADIREHGIREPLMIFEGKILDGRNRYRALQAIKSSGAVLGPGWGAFAERTIDNVDDLVASFRKLHHYMRSIDGADPLALVLSKNLHRRHLNESQRAMVAARIATLRLGANRLATSDDAQICAPSQTEAGERLNVARRSVQSARAVLDNAEPELIRVVDRGHLAVSEAAKAARLTPELQRQVAIDAEAGRSNIVRTAIKQAARASREIGLGDRQLALPDRKYGLILADPEWRFDTWSERGLDRSADNHYATSLLETIASRPVAEIAAADCVLCLWATGPMLPQALQVMEAWGFAYVSRVVWHKGGAPGTGYWFRDVAEEMLIGTRGNVPAPAPGTQWPSLRGGLKGEHSEKPDWQYEFGEAFFPTLPKIELNARQRRPGWDAWGFEAPQQQEGDDGGAEEDHRSHDDERRHANA